jgi:phosphocarrier protein
MSENTQGASEDGFLSRRVSVVNELGLHARPAARLAQAAQKFQAEIRLAAGNQKVDAKSILDILTLAAGNGANLELRAKGRDAADALDHLEHLFRRKFRED